jgi:hypothetical protein
MRFSKKVDDLGSEGLPESRASCCALAFRQAAAKASGRAATIGRLAAELARHQESPFHPDWSQLEALRGSWRECLVEIRRLQEALNAGKSSGRRQRRRLRRHNRTIFKALCRRNARIDALTSEIDGLLRAVGDECEQQFNEETEAMIDKCRDGGDRSMICYHDTTFCPFWAECSTGLAWCPRSLTPAVREKAQETGLPICCFTDKPECFRQYHPDESAVQ